MKKIAFLFLAGILALGLSSCGDNKTKEKVITGGILDASAGIPTTVTAGQTVSAVQTSVANVNTMIANALTSVKLAGTSIFAMPYGKGAPKLTEYEGDITGPDANGWMSWDYTATNLYNYYDYYAWKYRYRLLNSAGTPITGTTRSDLWDATDIKKYEYTYYYKVVLSTSAYWEEGGSVANPVKSYESNGDSSFEYTTANTWADGGTYNGNYNYILNYNDGATQIFTSTIKNLVISPTTSYGYGYFYWKYTGGSIDCNYFSWSYHMQYNSDGTGTGYMKGPGYSYTVRCDTNGTYTWTDDATGQVL
ncbi:MAG: hypothetical protein M0Q46_00020 [Endomicrobiales bacterium]|nr:hypothetical protein [Endomicrobiales bacterium]